MTWLAPITASRKWKRTWSRPRDGAVMPTTAREIQIEGVTYGSISDAMRALGCSASKVYRLIGEGWRVGCRSTEESA